MLQQIEISKDKKTVTFSLDKEDITIIENSLGCLCGCIDNEITEAHNKNNTVDTKSEEEKHKRIELLKERVKNTGVLIKLSKKDVYDLKNSLNTYYGKETIDNQTEKTIMEYLGKLDPLIDQMK